MFLIREVMDKTILDRDGLVAGKVDDVLLELPEGEHPIVRCIETQHGALAPHLGSLFHRVNLRLRKYLLDMGTEVLPITIDWNHVTEIDVTVHIDLDRHEAGLLKSEDAVWQRWIAHLPWADR